MSLKNRTSSQMSAVVAQRRSLTDRLWTTCGVIVSTAALATAMPQGGPAPDLLPGDHFVLRSAIQVDLATHSARLPLHRGTFQGTTYWYVLTDVSNAQLATELGLNFSPKLANAGRDCPSCVQVLPVSSDITDGPDITFAGVPDFAPNRLLIPGPTGFPPLATTPGAVAGPGYSPCIQVQGTSIVYNAPIVARGDGPFDVTTHTNTHDRVLAIDTVNRTVDLLIVCAFAAGKEIVYLSFDATAADTAVIERATFTPGLGLLSFPNGAFRPDGARAALFAFTNGQTGPTSPPAQGLNHVIIDGHNAEEATLANTGLLNALRHGGDARNVIESFPTMPQIKFEYSPMWDVHLTVWSRRKVQMGQNVAQTDSFVIRTLAEQFAVASPGGLKLASSGIVVNCPVVAFINDPPLFPVVPSPIPLPLEFHQ